MKFLKGLYKDSALIDQPQSTHRDALNMVMNLDKGSISTEYGNTPTKSSALINATIPKVLGPNRQERKINGSILLPDNKFIVFYSQRYYNTSNKKSASFIYLFDPEGDVMTLLFATSGDSQSEFYNKFAGDLNFSTEYPITGEARVAANGDIIVYFTDNYKDVKIDPITKIEYIDSYNPPRVFNVTKQLNVINNGGIVTNLYISAPTKFLTSTKHVDYLNLFLTTKKIPQIKNHSLIKGGILESGAYYLCLAYANDEYTETNIYTVSQPVYIPKGTYLDSTIDASATLSGLPEGGVTPSVPFEHMTGIPAGTQTSFGIKWNYSWRGGNTYDESITNAFDTNYPYIVPYIIKVSGNERSAYKLPVVPTDVFGTISFTGNENYAISSVEDIVLDKATYLTAKTITQLDNKLYLGNLTARKDIGYQRFANNIKVAPVIKEFKRFDNRVYDGFNLNFGYTEILKRGIATDDSYFDRFQDYNLINSYYKDRQLTSFIFDNDPDFWNENQEPATSATKMGGYRNQYTASYLKSYRRGEVYALYISFVLNDGTETYAYHIPGRDRNNFTAYDPISSLPSSLLDTTEEGMNSDYYAYYNQLHAKESETNDGFVYSNLTNTDLQNKLGAKPKYNKIVDTGQSVLLDREQPADDIFEMGYWTNDNEFYPQTPDFDIYDVNENGDAVLLGSLNYGVGEGNVRHHKFPSNLNTDYSYIKQDRTNLYKVRIPSSGIPDGSVEQSLLINLRTVTDSWNDQINQSAFFYETINILGFQLKNIKIPKFILKQIQGFKVYYAKRTLENKTILGQSLAHPSFFRAHGFFSTNRFSAYKKARGPFYKYWSFYGNIPDFNSGGQDAYIEYDSSRIGAYQYDSELDSKFRGYPIFKFHDFTMLRKKINLNIVDFVSVQSVVTMHQFAGGFRNTSYIDNAYGTVQNNIQNYKYVGGYEFFLTGQNENEDFSWVHADLGNLLSKYPIVDNNNTGDPTFGAFLDWAPMKGVHRLYTNIMIGARYNSYSNTGFDYENSSGAFSTTFIPRKLANVFTVTNNGATYINGLSYLKVTDVDAFHGAQYLDNYAGESAIAISLRTGLPFLKGHLPFEDEGAHQSVLFDKGATYEYGDGGILQPVNPLKEDTEEGFEAMIRGKANMLLVNLHSYKTDVFNPFDNQTLVWTGYYHPCQITETSLINGMIGDYEGCTQFISYNLESESDGNFSEGTIEGGNIQIINSGSTTPATFYLTGTSSEGDPFTNGETYLITITYSSLPTFSGDPAEISINGGTVVTFDDTAQLSYTVEVVAGTDGTDTLTYTTGKYATEFIGTITLTILTGNNCQPSFSPAYIEYALQNTGNTPTELTTYANSYGDNNNYYTGLETGWIFGGDTFICRYGYRSTSMDYPNYYLTQNIVDGDAITTGQGSQMSLPEIITGSVTPLTPPSNYSNTYLGTVAFFNQRVLRTYGGDKWPVFPTPGLTSLLTQFILYRTWPTVFNPSSGTNYPSNFLKLDNFKESPVPIAYSTLYSVFVESDDNINFRHAGDVVKGVSTSKSLFFDSYTAAEIVFRSPLIDLTSQDNLLYEEHYSALQDVKTTVPFPKKGEIETSFPSRVIRSNVQDGRIDDNFRSFLALQYKDFSQNKGAITNLVALNGLLFIHTEKSIYKTTGKQNLQLGDSTEAFIGSGDIFVQEPVELVTSNEGHGGSFNKHSSIISKYGYTYVSRKEKKVFLLADKLIEISQQGMENWFRLNIPYTLETINEDNNYPINLDSINYLNLDAPTGSFGFVSTYDPVFKRFIITKKELIPSDKFKLLSEYMIEPQIVNYDNNFDPNSCTEAIGFIEVSQPYGTGITLPVTPKYISYFAEGANGENPAIWFDPILGGYIFNGDAATILTNEGIIYNNFVTTLNLPYDSSEDCKTQDFYFFPIINDNFWWKESGWTVSYYPDNQTWVSRHSYISPWYFYNTENFYSFSSLANKTSPEYFVIWKHNNTNAAIFYNINYPYEFEFVVNDSPDITKVLASVNFIADVYNRSENGKEILIEAESTNYLKDKLNTYLYQLPFDKFYIYNNSQISGYVDFNYLNNIRKVEGTWTFNDFRDLIKYNYNSFLSTKLYNISGGFNTNVQTPDPTVMFTGEGIINPNIIDATKPWHDKKKFINKFFAIRLIGNNQTNKLVNLYAANAVFRKSSR